jgi:uncharacterized membrane protein YphA (DoxX/SURF4 family)
MALLLLRTVIGLSLIVQGVLYFLQPGSTLVAWLVGSVAVAVGGLLLAGLLTPLAGLATGMGIVGIMLSSLPVTTPTLLDSPSSIAFALAIVIAIIVLGPGGFSVDARLFGRREIIIPLPTPESER